MLAPTAFRAKVRGTKYREANDPETEIWRACQRSGTAVDGGRCFLLLSDVGTRPGGWCILLIGPRNSGERGFARPRAETGVKCRQANTLRFRSNLWMTRRACVFSLTRCSPLDGDERNGSKSGRDGGN